MHIGDSGHSPTTESANEPNAKNDLHRTSTY
jgi:hypothetical protein